MQRTYWSPGKVSGVSVHPAQGRFGDYSPRIRAAASSRAASTVAAPEVMLDNAEPIALQKAPIYGLDGIGIPVDALAMVAATFGSACAAPADLSAKAPNSLLAFQTAKPSSVKM